MSKTAERTRQQAYDFCRTIPPGETATLPEHLPLWSVDWLAARLPHLQFTTSQSTLSRSRYRVEATTLGVEVHAP